VADTRLNLTRAEAGAARQLKMRDATARPSERMASRESGAPRGYIPSVRARVELTERKAGDKTKIGFEGFASVTGQFYEMYDMFGPYLEQVHVGSFVETLAKPGLDVPLVLDHVSSRRIARTGNEFSPLHLTEVLDGEQTGLLTSAPDLQMSDTDTSYIVEKMRLQLIDEMSFRFMINSGSWNEDYTEYHIHSVDIHRGDVSIVGYGANPLTTGAGLRTAPAEMSMASRVLQAQLLADVRR
jgi:HK97 family phage prohead protease